MKLQHLNLGKPLSREEQKKITGGQPLCDPDTIVVCLCADDVALCDIVVNQGTPSDICENDGACDDRGGLVSATGCFDTCPGA